MFADFSGFEFFMRETEIYGAICALIIAVMQNLFLISRFHHAGSYGQGIETDGGCRCPCCCYISKLKFTSVLRLSLIRFV